MPDIKTDAQIFDIAFHPSESLVYTGLLTGGIKSYRYDEEGAKAPEEAFSVRPSKRSCRGLALNADGSKLYAAGRGKAMYTVDTSTGKVIDSRLSAHQSPINRIKNLTPNLLCTGDDDGVVKLWDPRSPNALREYTHHYDFISDFMYISDKRQLVITSGDGTLSVVDVRAKRDTPVAHSEDQEDELLSIVPIRGGAKTVVGTQLGILAVFNRSSGWGDCVDRVPGHPHSIDALCNLPSSLSSDSTILTGSSDGLLRVVQLFPTKLVGVIADHGELPIERIAVDRGGEGNWVGSVGHDEMVRLTDLREALEEDAKNEGDDDSDSDEDDEEGGENGDQESEKLKGKKPVKQEKVADAASDKEEADSESDSDQDSDKSSSSSSDSDADSEDEKDAQRDDISDAENQSDDSDDGDSEPIFSLKRKKSRVQPEDVFGAEKRRRKRHKMDEVVAEPSFFADL